MNYDILFLLLNLVLAFYNVGIIWAHEIDIFRNWRFVDKKDFHTVQYKHWKKLPYWVFTPVAVSLAGSILLLTFHPAGSPSWAIYGNISLQILALVLTGMFWGRWQAKLSRDEKGPDSEYLHKILRTHWIRTLLINSYAAILLVWTIILVT